MNYVILENTYKVFGDKVLLEDVSLQINKGDKIALIAKNGTGKSTLLKILAGIEPPEGENAKLWLYKDVRFSYLPQEPEFIEDQTILEAILEADNPTIHAIKNYELAMLLSDDQKRLQKALEEMDKLKAWETESKIKEILYKLNITDFSQTVGTLSGGQKKRLALAKMIIEDPEILILDEPTNHLDVEMIEWLENYMKHPQRTIFMVTHDRYFLERVCNRIIELDRGKLYRYQGNYSDFLEKKTSRTENEATELQKTQKLLKRELEWIRRMPKARGTKAKSRVGKFEEIKEKASSKLDDQNIQLDFKSSRLGSKILEAQYISKKFDKINIIENFHYKFKKGERVGVVGPNGVGKSTFLNLLTGQIPVDSGKVVIGDTVVFGFYTQEGIQLDKDMRVIDAVRQVAEYIPMQKGQKLTAIQLLDRFLFTREQHQVYISQLSGGERRRLYLLIVLMQYPNFLILDEPTNDLDIITLNVLEEFLSEFPGCLMIVTHDRYFMDKLVDHLFIFYGDGRVKDFNGDYSAYRDWKTEQEREEKRQERALNETESSSENNRTKRPGSKQKNRLKKIELLISNLETRKAEIMEVFANQAPEQDRIKILSLELSEIKDELENLENEWLELSIDD